MKGHKTKCISIRNDQDKWIEETSMNLSHFVQKKLDERINRDK